MEPATFGLPLIIGPRFDKFQEAIDLVKLKGCSVIKDGEELKLEIDKLYYDSINREIKEKITAQYISENIGATKKIVKEASEFLSTSPEELVESISKLKAKSQGAKKSDSSSSASSDSSHSEEKTIALPSNKKLLVGSLNEDKGALRGAIEQKLKNKIMCNTI